MARVFLCYCRKDGEFARRLTADLDRLGADVWIDVDDIRSGDDWSDAIQQALDGCLVMVLIISPDAMASANVSNEWKYFMENGRPIIPLLFKPARIHFRLKPLQYINFHHQTYAAVFRQLCAALVRQGVPLAPLPTTNDDVTFPAATVLSRKSLDLQRLERKRSRHRLRLLSVLLPVLGLAAALVVIGIILLSLNAASYASGDGQHPHATRKPSGLVGVDRPYVSPTAGQTVTPLPDASPTPPGSAPNVRLLYDDHEFLLLNISDETLDISRLVFEQSLPNGTAREFEAGSWDHTGMTGRPAAMIPGACYQLLTAEGRQTAPSHAMCPTFLGFFSTGVARRHFWISEKSDAVFTVHQLGDATLLATCTIDAGRCEFYLPE